MNKASRLKKHLWWGATASIAALTVIAATPSKAAEAREQLREQFDKALKGKTVAWAPVWLGVLESEWTRVMKAHFDDYGIKFEVRDANFKSDVQLQAVSALINEHPDVLVVQNPNVTLLAKELKRAMEAGIYVVQVNMASNTLTDAYVGVDAKDMGRRLAKSMIGDCGGGKGSGEVSILEGEATAAYSLDMKNGAMEVFKTDPSIKVVSSQPTSWDANKAGEITATVLQQHPNLCGILSVWGPQAAGAAQAIKAAGKSATSEDLCRERRPAGRLRPARAGRLLPEPVLPRRHPGRSDRRRGNRSAAERRQAGHQAHRLLHHTGLGESEGRSRVLLHRSEGREVTHDGGVRVSARTRFVTDRQVKAVDRGEFRARKWRGLIGWNRTRSDEKPAAFLASQFTAAVPRRIAREAVDGADHSVHADDRGLPRFRLHDSQVHIARQVFSSSCSILPSRAWWRSRWLSRCCPAASIFRSAPCSRCRIFLRSISISSSACRCR